MGRQQVILEKDGGIATLIFNRPDKMNALAPRILAEAAEAVREVKEDDEVKVLVVTGAGRGFCSGADLSPEAVAERQEMKPSRRLKLTPFQGFGHLIMELADVQKPTIAAVNGAAVGAGLSVALACDIRIASDLARFAAIFVRRGLMPDSGATFYLPRVVGISRACELFYTGEIIDAKEAERIGLVSRVVSHDDLMTATRTLAEKIAKGPSIPIEMAKQAVYQGLYTDLPTAIAFEGYAQDLCHQSEDAKEGRQAFLEKREPVFKGR